MSALEGLRVIELAHERIAFCGKLLGDMGADVILVEPPQGETSRTYPPYLDDTPGPDRSLYFWHYNTSKRSVVLDLNDPEGIAQLTALLNTADVLIESEPTMRLAELGVDYDTLSRRNPRLIHAAMTPYGRNEPLSNLPCTDLTLMAAGGPPWSCGYDDHALPPVRGWGQQSYHTGCHFTFLSVLTALLHRKISGRGQFIDISMVAALNVTTEAATYSWLVNGSTVQRQTGRHAAILPTGETQMRCADGRYVNTGVPPRFAREFARLLDWLNDLGLVEDFPEAVFLEAGAKWEGPFDLSKLGVDDEITAIFSAGRDALKLVAERVDAQTFFEGCQRAGLAVGVVNSPEEAFEDPHFKARGFQVEVDHEGTTHRYPGAPYKLAKGSWQISRRAPRLGEHTLEVLAAITSV